MTCPIHGDLLRSQCYWTRSYPSCKECVKARSRSWFHSNKDKGLATRKIWRDANKTDQHAKKKAYRESKPEFIRRIKREHARVVKSAALYFYSHGSMQCAECGDGVFQHLCLDHIDGGGCRHRSSDSGTRGKAIYAWVKRHKYPAGFRVLCWNCNFKAIPRTDTGKYAKYTRRLKHSVLAHYANGVPRCRKCGELDITALTVDHMNGGGRQHLLGLQMKGGAQFYRWLRDQGFPQGYQVLCFNCNCSKSVT